MNSEFTSSSAGIGYDKYSDHVDLFMNAQTYQVINNTSIKNESQSLEQLAQTNANLAYKLTKTVMFIIAKSGFDTITVDQTQIANKEDDSTEMTAQLGRTLLESLPDEDTVAFDYSISLYPSKDDIDILGANPNDLIVMISARTEPPSLAA
jgi:hypothetical protein